VGLVPDFARTDEAVCYALELCLSQYIWPFMNTTFASLGWLLLEDMKSKRMIEKAQFTPPFPTIVKRL